MNTVSCIRWKDSRISEVNFETLRNGDIIFVKGNRRIVCEDAHRSDDPSYDGYLLYDIVGNSYFPEDLDSDIEPLLLKNLHEDDKVWVEGDSADLWIKDYNVRVSSMATVECTPAPRAKKVLVTINSIDGDSKVTTYVRKSALRIAYNNNALHEPGDGPDSVSCIRREGIRIISVDFKQLKKGDRFFVDGVEHTVGEDARQFGDASHDNYLLYDTDGNVWFPEDLDIIF